MKPTKSPTWSPVTYDDEVNTLFCGETFLDASEKCFAGLALVTLSI
jgi:hypothetical protein